MTIKTVNWGWAEDLFKTRWKRFTPSEQVSEQRSELPVPTDARLGYEVRGHSVRLIDLHNGRLSSQDGPHDGTASRKTPQVVWMYDISIGEP